MDIYIVLDGLTVVGASARMQGAELIRANRAQELADGVHAHDRGSANRGRSERIIYDRQRIVNVELQDVE